MSSQDNKSTVSIANEKGNLLQQKLDSYTLVTLIKLMILAFKGLQIKQLLTYQPYVKIKEDKLVII